MIDAGALVVALAAGGAYAVGVRRLSSTKDRRWPLARSAAWALAVLVGLAATHGPLGTREVDDLRAHMGQHVLLGMVVPLLAALGAPLTLALQAGGTGTRRALRGALRSRAGRALAHPVVGWCLFGGGIAALYLTPLLDVAARNAVVHAAVHAHVVLSGFLFLVPLIGADALPHPLPFGARMVAVLVAVPFHAFVGLALLSARDPVAPVAYPSLPEQRTAAGILMGSGEVLSLVVAALVFARWWATEQRRRRPHVGGGGHALIDAMPPPVVERRARFAALRPLRHRDFALVWSAALVSNVGTWMETVAVGDLVTNQTGQARWTAIVAAAAFLPMGLMGPIGGAIADRVDRRRFVIVTTLLHMACAAALTVLAATGRAEPAAVTAVVFVAGCVAGIGFPAYQAMIPDLVPREELLGAVSLGQAQYNLGRVIGPALAGVAIAVGSYSWAFAINTVSFAGLLLALGRLRLPPTPPDPDPVAGDLSVWGRIRTGATAARREPGVSSAILMISLVALTASPFIVLLPAMARVRFDGGSSLTSAFVTAQGVGAVAGALVVPSLADRLGRRPVLLGGLVALPATLALYGAAPTPGLATGALVLVGAAYIVVFSGIGAVVQLRAPAALRARILSLYFLALGVLYPVGSTIQGAIADHVGLPAVTIGSGVALLAVVGLLAVLRPERLRSLDDVTTPPPLSATERDPRASRQERAGRSRRPRRRRRAP